MTDNGRIIGPPNNPTSIRANGSWSSEEQYDLSVNQNWIKVVTDGLVLFLDSTNPSSYPGSGTVWYDLSPTGLNFSGSDASFMSSGRK